MDGAAMLFEVIQWVGHPAQDNSSGLMTGAPAKCAATLPGPQKRGTWGTLILIWNDHGDRGTLLLIWNGHRDRVRPPRHRPRLINFPPRRKITGRGSTMATAATDPKQYAHELIDAMAPGQVSTAVGLLETILDPVSRALANAPLEDE